MTNRYNVLHPSVVKDIDDEVFPDVLSINYRKVLEETNIFSKPFVQIEVDESFQLKPYILAYKLYQYMDADGNTELDDVLLTLNNIKHLNILPDPLVIYAPEADILDIFLDTYSTEQ